MRRCRFGRTFTVALAIVLATGCASRSSPVPSGAAATGPPGSVAPGSPAPVGSPVASESGGTPSGGPASAPLEVSVAVAVTGFDAPLEIADPGDGSGRLFVAEQAGRIRIVQDGALADQPFLDITDRIASGGERGLLGLAFHPDFPNDPRFFVDYTDRDGNTVISYFRV